MSYGRGVFVKRNGIWTETTPRIFDSNIAPVDSVTVTITVNGAGGGSGASDAAGAGYTGIPGRRVTGTITLHQNDFLQIACGSAGADGSGGGNAAGGTNPLGFNGGQGGYPGNEGSSGGGGGGGAASVVLLNKEIIIVAGGGGGGGGSGANSPGRAAANANQNTGSNVGTPGQDKTSGGEHPAQGGGGGGGCKIICTKLYQLGLLPEEIYEADQAYGEQLQERMPMLYNGYRAWAEVVVDWMSGSGPKMMPWMSDEEFSQAATKWSVKWAEDIATPWAEEMAYQMGSRDQGNSIGKAIMAVGVPISIVVGVWNKVFGESKRPTGFVKGIALIGVFTLLRSIVAVGNTLKKIKGSK